MKIHIYLLSFATFYLFILSCQSQTGNSEKENSISEKLTAIENNQDEKLLDKIFYKDAIIYLPDAMPIYGKTAIVDLYRFIWNKNGSQPQTYVIDSVTTKKDSAIEFGKYIYKQKNTVDTLSYVITTIKEQKEMKIKEIVYGNSKENWLLYQNQQENIKSGNPHISTLKPKLRIIDL